MKRPIKPSEIRKGDLIRYEGQDQSTTTRAVEFCADRDGQSYLPVILPGQHYLLDRPTPAVELPTKPTLGWLTWDIEAHRSRDFGFWWSAPLVVGPGVRGVTPGAIGRLKDEVTAFTPATAVSTAALDELQAGLIADPTHGELISAVATFLDAVDKAGESA